MNSKYKTILTEYCRKLFDKGYLPGLDGNISLRAQEDTILITPSGMGKDIVTEKDLVTVRLDGTVLDDAGKKPSMETPIHLAAYQSKSINAVIHMHSPCVTAFALCRKKIDTRHAPFAYYHLGDIGYVSYSPPGTGAFHEEVTSCIKKEHTVILFESHGSMVMAFDMPSAFAKADLLENYAKMLIYAQQIGGAHMMSEKELREITAG